MASQIEFYKECIKRLLEQYESLTTERSHVETIFDDERMRYTAFRIGWNKSKRIHLCLVHIDICQEEIIIQCNNTEDLIATELSEMGISRAKIYLGFIPAEAPQENGAFKNSDIITRPATIAQNHQKKQALAA